MDARLRQILELALRPETGEGESSAALAAARRLVAKQGMGLLSVQPEATQESTPKVNYKTVAHTLTIPARFTHTMFERVIQDARSLNLEFRMIRCKTKEADILSGTVLEFEITGSRANVIKYENFMEDYIQQINRKIKQPDPVNTPKPAAKTEQSWFSKLFNRGNKA